MGKSFGEKKQQGRRPRGRDKLGTERLLVRTERLSAGWWWPGAGVGWDGGVVRHEAAEGGRDPNVDVSRSGTEIVGIVLSVMCGVWRGFSGWNRTI